MPLVHDGIKSADGATARILVHALIGLQAVIPRVLYFVYFVFTPLNPLFHLRRMKRRVRRVALGLFALMERPFCATVLPVLGR